MTLFLSFFLALSPADYEAVAKQPGACHFPAPKGWEMVDPKVLLPEVKVMARGKAKSDASLPPSINLAMEETQMTMPEYLEEVRAMYAHDRNKRWASIGTLTSKAGVMALTQLDQNTKWGDVRMLQAILIKDAVAYVITATAQVSEFTGFSKEFLSCMQAFEINPKAE